MGRERERGENKKKKIARVESQAKYREKWGGGGNRCALWKRRQ